MTTVRQKIVAAARWGIAHESQIHYGQIRPIPLGRTLPLTTDCSGFVTVCYFLAGAPDPNGLGYNGEGWTGTLLRHLEPVEQEDARRGDLAVWGVYPGRHVAMVLEPGEDPLLCSHGHEHGPLEIRFSDESRFQPPVVTWLDGLRTRATALAPDEDCSAFAGELERRAGGGEDGLPVGDG